MTRHKHADLIHAWAEGAEIQIKRNSEGVWADDWNPSFFDFNEYRIKPRTVKREGWVNIYRSPGGEFPSTACIHPSEEAAKAFASSGTVARVKVEWEEEE